MIFFIDRISKLVYISSKLYIIRNGDNYKNIFNKIIIMNDVIVCKYDLLFVNKDII